jgi:hypothetical protein
MGASESTAGGAATLAIPVVAGKRGESPVYRSVYSPSRLLDGRDDVATLFDNFQRGVRLGGRSPCLGTRTVQASGALGPYVWVTYEEASALAMALGSGLASLGLGAVRGGRGSDAWRIGARGARGAGGDVRRGPLWASSRRIAPSGCSRSRAATRTRS